jgi:hypothetical protein
LAKKSLIMNGEPMRRNAKTEKSVLVTDERDFMVERQRLRESIDRFASGGPRICTKHPHFFFGPLTPVEWAVLNYQHLDHHLRQFGGGDITRNWPGSGSRNMRLAHSVGLPTMILCETRGL